MSCGFDPARLEALVDDAADAAERADVAAHVAACADCRRTLAELQAIHDAAGRLGPMAPPDHVWLEVAGQIRLTEPSVPAEPAAARSARPAVWQWIGIAAALVVVTASVYLLRSPSVPPPAAATASNVAPAATVESIEQELQQAEAHYDNAISQLESMARTGDASLDPVVAATLQRNLSAIDQAIVESRQALNQDPGSMPARESLFAALRRKVSVLQETVALVNEMRKGDPEGAARAAAGIKGV